MATKRTELSDQDERICLSFPRSSGQLLLVGDHAA